MGQQWTIDPVLVIAGKAGSEDVTSKALAAEEARVVVRATRNVFFCPSWTRPSAPRTELQAWLDTTYRYRPDAEPPAGWYKGLLVFDPRGWKVLCWCPATGPCHHGYAFALAAQRLDGTKAPTPSRERTRKPGKRSHLTVIPGGAR